MLQIAGSGASSADDLIDRVLKAIPSEDRNRMAAKRLVEQMVKRSELAQSEDGSLSLPVSIKQKA